MKTSCVMDQRQRGKFFRPISRRLNSLNSNALFRGAEAFLRHGSSSTIMNGDIIDSVYDDDNLAPVMPAIDAVQQLMEEEKRNKVAREPVKPRTSQPDPPKNKLGEEFAPTGEPIASSSKQPSGDTCASDLSKIEETATKNYLDSEKAKTYTDRQSSESTIVVETQSEAINHIKLVNYGEILDSELVKKNEDYEFIPKSVILDIYSNDPEVKRFLRQLPRIGNEFGYNEQDYKCYSCRRPIGMVFGQSRLCHFDGHHYCSECHLGEKATIPARILCNWDFNKYPISKRNQHFLTLISNEPMFELKTVAPLLFRTCPELREIEELRCQAFFIRSYCFTCVQDSISFELTKLVWPREHLIKQTDTYSIEDLIQIKSGTLKQVLKNVITFGRQHVLSCMLCCQKGFICEICKSSQIIYPFDTESVHRCNICKSIYHKVCFKSRPGGELCPRCQRLKARRNGV